MEMKNFKYLLVKADNNTKDTFEFRFLKGLLKTSNTDIIVVDCAKHYIYENDLNILKEKMKLTPINLNNQFFVKYLESLNSRSKFELTDIKFKNEHFIENKILNELKDLLKSKKIFKNFDVIKKINQIITTYEVEIDYIYIQHGEFEIFKITSLGEIYIMLYNALDSLERLLLNDDFNTNLRYSI